jgi:protein SCO1/2
LGQYVENKNDHSVVMIIGNEATGLWKKAYALAGPAELVKIVEQVANDKSEPAKYEGQNKQ